MEIIVKKDISHYNRALNKYIRTKSQYNDEMKRQGMVSEEKGNYLAEKAREKMRKPYKVDLETRKFLEEVKSHSKKGKVKLSGRELEFMKKKGVKFERPDYKGLKGGF